MTFQGIVATVPSAAGPDAASFAAVLIEQSDDCVKTLSLDGRLLSMNGPGLCAMEIDDFGTVAGTSWPLLWPEEARPEVEAAVAAAARGQTARFKAFCPTAKGTPKWWSVTVAPVPRWDGQTGGLMSVSRDITELRQTQAEVAGLRLQSQRTARLNAMGAFASTIAHELNQPLTAVANYLSAGRALLQRAPSLDISALDGALGAAAQQAVRAGDIIRRLRDFVATGAVSKQPAAVDRLIRNAVWLALADDEAALRLQIDIEPGAAEVLVDATQIEQVLTNLLRNAADVLRGRADATIKVKASPDGDGRIRITVRDNGPGIDTAKLPDLFSTFSSTKSDGLGVGLAIARIIVEAHGGRIWHEAPDDGGAAFHVDLPT